MTDETVHQGGCLCGAVRYRITAEPLRATHCHCSMCRRASGAAFLTMATFPSAALTWTEGGPAIYRSSANAERGFCARCGGALTFQSIDDRGEIDVSIGSFDRPEAISPTHHVWFPDRIAWLEIDDRLPRYPRSTADGLNADADEADPAG